MEAEDEITKAKDVQMLRVTKELQERLMMSNIQAKDQQQIETLEKTIDLNKKVSKISNFFPGFSYLCHTSCRPIVNVLHATTEGYRK